MKPPTSTSPGSFNAPADFHVAFTAGPPGEVDSIAQTMPAHKRVANLRSALPERSPLRNPAPEVSAPRVIPLTSATTREEGGRQIVSYVRQHPRQISARDRAATLDRTGDSHGPTPTWRAPVPHAASRAHPLLAGQFPDRAAFYGSEASENPVDMGSIEIEPDEALTGADDPLASMGWTFVQRPGDHGDDPYTTTARRLLGSKWVGPVFGSPNASMLPTQRAEVHDLAVPVAGGEPVFNGHAPEDVRRIPVVVDHREPCSVDPLRSAGDATSIGEARSADRYDLGRDALVIRPRLDNEVPASGERTLVVLAHGNSSKVREIALDAGKVLAFDGVFDAGLLSGDFMAVSELAPASVHWVADGLHHVDSYSTLDGPGDAADLHRRHAGSSYPGRVADLSLTEYGGELNARQVHNDIHELATMFAIDHGVDVALVRSAAERGEGLDPTRPLPKFHLSTLFEQLRSTGLYDDYAAFRINACRYRVREGLYGVANNLPAGLPPVVSAARPVREAPALVGHAEVVKAAKAVRARVLDQSSPAPFAAAVREAVAEAAVRHVDEITKVKAVANKFILGEIEKASS